MRLVTLGLVLAMLPGPAYADDGVQGPAAVRLMQGQPAPYTGTLTPTWAWEAELSKRVACETERDRAVSEAKTLGISLALEKSECAADAVELNGLLTACQAHVKDCEDAKAPVTIEHSGPSWGTAVAMAALSALVTVVVVEALR